jgi:hypothetical protein
LSASVPESESYCIRFEVRGIAENNCGPQKRDWMFKLLRYHVKDRDTPILFGVVKTTVVSSLLDPKVSENQNWRNVRSTENHQISVVYSNKGKSGIS